MPDNQWSGSESTGDGESDKRQEYHCHVNCVEAPHAQVITQRRLGTVRAD